jgi:hypothetical protein
VHTSPFCWQNDEGLQKPAWQKAEQQSEATTHELLRVLQVVLSGVHVPLEPQLPPQHWLSVMHVPPSWVQVPRLQTPPVQTPEQQSLGFIQPAPI